MKSSVETLEPTRVRLTVEVPFEELKSEMDKAYKDIAGQVNIPGFRKGHVPPRIIDQRFGRAAVIEQVVNEVLPGHYSSAVASNDLRPMAQPEVEVTEIPNTTGPQGSCPDATGKPLTMAVGKNGEVSISCDTGFSASGAVLSYDASAKSDAFACTSKDDGVECWSQVTGQGFKLSRDSQINKSH